MELLELKNTVVIIQSQCMDLYLSLIAAVTDDHKPRSLKQYEFIILWFWRPDTPNGSHGAKTKVCQGRSQDSVSLPLLASRGRPLLGSWVPPTWAVSGQVLLTCVTRMLTILPLSLSRTRNPVVTTDLLGESRVMSPSQDPKSHLQSPFCRVK